MRGFRFILLVFAAMPALVAAVQADPKRDPAHDRIATLVRQLGDGKFQSREAASKELTTIGEPALPAIRHAAATTKDNEIRRRARQLDRAIMLGARKSRSLGLETALIDPGDFTMGSPTNESERNVDESSHKVSITRPFLLAVYETTQDEYQRFAGRNPL